jgi:hypothetical protein
MSKPTVTRLFFGAIAALAVGLVMSLATIIAALAGGAIHIGGPSVVHVNAAAIAGALPWLLIAAVVFAAGAAGALASWVGALLNTWKLEDKTWFVALLVLGVFSFGWIAMAAYVIAGPDSTSREAAHPGVATASGA